MSLKNYVLNGPSVVILEDDRDPYVSWQHHLDRTGGARGGVDLVAAVGTPILAPTAGTMVHVPDDGSAGNSSRFYHDDNEGWKDVFSHISTYAGKSGQHFEQGDVIAYSGDSGGVAPHVHRHLLDPSNVRRNPWDYFTPSSAAGGNERPITPQEEEMAAAVVIQQVTGSGKNTLWHLPDDNSTPTAIKTMDELRSLIATGAIRKVNPSAPSIEMQHIIVPSDDVILTRRQSLSQRKP